MDNFLYKIDRIVAYENVKSEVRSKVSVFREKIHDIAHFSVHTFELYDETDSVAV